MYIQANSLSTMGFNERNLNGVAKTTKYFSQRQKIDSRNNYELSKRVKISRTSNEFGDAEQ